MSISNHDNLFTNKIHVRIDDMIYGHHLCHSKFINLIHNTRALFLKKHNLSEANCFGYGLIMLNLNIDYINQCFFDDMLEISLNIDKIEKAKFLLTYSVFNRTSNKLAANATTLMGFMDIEKGKLKRVPVEFLNLINNISNNKSI
jgi:YbgC/YbaW family acyl-CoA thioester hydrolase